LVVLFQYNGGFIMKQMWRYLMSREMAPVYHCLGLIVLLLAIFAMIFHAYAWMSGALVLALSLFAIGMTRISIIEKRDHEFRMQLMAHRSRRETKRSI